MGQSMTRPGERRCNQCYFWKKYPEEYIGPRGVPRKKNCAECGKKYAPWSKMSIAEKIATVPPREDPAPTGRMLFTLRSGNKKLGPIPVSMSERGTCPPSCALYTAGCYANYGLLGSHWRGTNPKTLDKWISWGDFLERVRELPEGQLWRHNEAGDLRGSGQQLDIAKLGQLVQANEGRRGFTYTHRTSLSYTGAYMVAIKRGFVINLSVDSTAQADQFARRGLPVVVTLPHDAPDRGNRTPDGRRIVVCPAQTVGTTCAECELCANPHRHSVVGFRAHGRSKAIVTELIRARRPAEAAAE